jgi:hypothetical protein
VMRFRMVFMGVQRTARAYRADFVHETVCFPLV